MKLVKEYDESRGWREEDLRPQLERVQSTNYFSYATRSHDEYATAILSLIKSHRNWNLNARRTYTPRCWYSRSHISAAEHVGLYPVYKPNISQEPEGIVVTCDYNTVSLQ